jgi:hypothetical protein
VSTGLLENMRPDEVLAHEIAHISNGDMVTMTLLQGVINAFVMFLARLIAYALSERSRESGRGGGSSFMVVMVLQIVLGIFGSMITAWFSRHREFRADAAGAQLAGRDNMIGALERLKAATKMPETMPETLVAFGISSGMRQDCRRCSRRTHRSIPASPRCAPPRKAARPPSFARSLSAADHRNRRRAPRRLASATRDPIADKEHRPPPARRRRCRRTRRTDSGGCLRASRETTEARERFR